MGKRGGGGGGTFSQALGICEFHQSYFWTKMLEITCNKRFVSRELRKLIQCYQR